MNRLPLSRQPGRRAAIAMIELIFAIVIMGITLMSLPMIIRQSSQGTYTALQQESVAILASHIQTVMTLEWDNENNASNHYPVLQTSSTAIPSCNTPFPPGTSDQEGRYCLYDSSSSYLSASALGQDSDDIFGNDDIDDYDNNTTTATLYANEQISTCLGNYIDLDIVITTDVDYLDDAPRNSTGTVGTIGETTTYSNPFNYVVSSSGNTRNIKAISVKLTTTNTTAELGSKEIRLSALMCNIGAPRRYYSKDY